MGRIYLENFGGSKLFTCKSCDSFLTSKEQLLSTRFTGATGRAYLFDKVVNLKQRYTHLFSFTTILNHYLILFCIISF